MNTILIEPTDVLFFRDAIPMSAGQGKGAGCRMPFPSTLHEAFRACLLRERGEIGLRKSIAGRPRTAPRKGNWHAEHDATDIHIASRAFRSLRTVGPLPWDERHRLLVPTPLDSVLSPHGDKLQLHRLQLWRDNSVPWPMATQNPSDYRPPCLPMAVTPPDKRGRLCGWWTATQMRRYLDGDPLDAGESYRPVPTSELWEPEHRIGLEIEPGSFAAREHQLYAGDYMRPGGKTWFLVQLEVGDPRATDERQAIASLDWLLLGGEFRLARLWHRDPAGRPLPDYLADLKQVPTPPQGDRPCLLKWVLVTPAIFRQGSLPGWCVDTKKDRPGGPLPVGRVCFDLPGQAQLVSWCSGRPRVVSGWDVVDGCAKPTMLAVPEGAVYYFLCRDSATASALSKKLHWQPRSDFYGEKGCGYGLVSLEVKTHSTSADVRTLANELFNK